MKPLMWWKRPEPFEDPETLEFSCDSQPIVIPVLVTGIQASTIHNCNG